MDYTSMLSPSTLSDIAGVFPQGASSSIASAATAAQSLTSGSSLFSTAANLGSQIPGVDALSQTLNDPASAAASALGFGTAAGDALGGTLTDAFTAAATDTTWTFICTPDEISWTTSNAVNRIEIFGTNNPPAISGTKGMREFNLNNALVEGFTRNRKVEAKVAALEDLLKYKSSTTGGYVNVPVYQVWANQKGYGQQAFYLLKSVQVKETMRDLAGDSTRAYVDVSFVEVPAFQVDSGIDQAPFAQQGSTNPLVNSYSQALTNQVTTATAAFNAAANQVKPASGASSASPKPATAT